MFLCFLLDTRMTLPNARAPVRAFSYLHKVPPIVA
jgi:hypothetical protein